MPHIHEKIDFTVEVFIVHKDRVLLRLHDKYKKWLSVGGHIELDEDPMQAAVREVKEEVGLDVVLMGHVLQTVPMGEGYYELLPPRFLNRHRINDTHEHVTLVYFARTQSDAVRAGGSDRSDDWHWFTRQELEEEQYHLEPAIKAYAQEALKELAS